MRSVGIHMCRGNFSGRHLANGGYEWVAERFFARADANHFLLEYDTPRAGDFAPLRFVPKGKGVVLGLISSKTPVLETIDSLQRRVDEATKYIAPERLAISPQCGFASSAGGNPLTETDERTKLRLAVNAARDLAIADGASALRPWTVLHFQSSGGPSYKLPHNCCKGVVRSSNDCRC